MVRDDLFPRQPKVAKYFNRTPWWVSVTDGLHSRLVVSVAPALPTADLHMRLLRFIPASRRLARHRPVQPPKPRCIEHARVLAAPRQGPRRIKSIEARTM